MNTPKHFHLQQTEKHTFKCELEHCPVCGHPILISNNLSGRKFVQTLTSTLRVSYRHGQCTNLKCPEYTRKWCSSQWQQLAPKHSSYGFDVIARIGWLRQNENREFEHIHQELSQFVTISESQVRHLYYYRYLPLVACLQREQWDELEQISKEFGLILSLDGLAPEGGKPQLWVVQELHTGLALRSGWMSEQSQTAFENFLEPITREVKERGLKISGIISDKQRGLLPAIKTVFKGIPHGYCHAHYLNNLSQPIADADEKMKVTLRQRVREEVGGVIRQEKTENRGVLTVTGLIPSKPSEDVPTSCVLTERDQQTKPPEEVVEALLRRTRYLLTLKGRAPFCLAFNPMYERLTSLKTELDHFINHYADPRLVALRQGLKTALQTVAEDYCLLQQAHGWLLDISDLLEKKEEQPSLPGAQVKKQLFDYLDKMSQDAQNSKLAKKWVIKMKKTTHNYKKGLFRTYDVEGLPRTNNQLEGNFKDYKHHLRRTTGQIGATRRLIERCGAWEILQIPHSCEDIVADISQVSAEEFIEERERVRQHRERFQLQTRGIKWVKAQFDKLKEIWESFKPQAQPETA